MSDAFAALDRTFRLARNLTGQAWSDEQILHALTSTSVAIVADEGNLENASGQSCISTLFGLVGACGCPIKLVMPNSQMFSWQPPLAGKQIRDALLDLGSDIIPAFRADSERQTSDRDLVFIIGDTPWAGESKQSWRLSGSDWGGAISAPTSPGSRWLGSFPVGAGIAAAMAAAEPFKAALRKLALPEGRHLWSLQPVQSANVGFPEVHTVNQIDLGAIDFISGGAITNACLHLLFRVPGLSARARLFEPEALDVSNLNRYMLARRSDVDGLKVDIIRKWAPQLIEVEAYRDPITAETIGTYRPLRPNVVLGVDNLPTRWLVQAEWPAWLTCGATADVLVMSSEHRPGRSCVGCLYDRDDGINLPLATASFVSYWAGLLTAIRILRQAMGSTEWQERQALNLYPHRLDSDSALLWRPIPPNDECPVQCGSRFLA